MNADILRRAANLMRERAKAARSGRWIAAGSELFADWDDPRYIGICDGSLPEGNTANAEHIASWHPDVALAVAMLLDNEANAMEAADEGLAILPYNHARSELLTDIARKYLGSES